MKFQSFQLMQYFNIHVIICYKSYLLQVLSAVADKTCTCMYSLRRGCSMTFDRNGWPCIEMNTWMVVFMKWAMNNS